MYSSIDILDKLESLSKESEDFKAISDKIHKNFESFYKNDICDEGKCKWYKKCSEVIWSGKEDIKLSIRIKDFDTDHTYYV